MPINRKQLISFILIFTLSQIDAGCFSRSFCDLRINNNCYVHIDETVNWDIAESCCVAWGGHLASIHSDHENDLLNSIRNEDRFTWIGLNDKANEGTFVWTDETRNDYNKFAQGEPNNAYSGGGSEQCVLFNHKRRAVVLEWNDLPCSLTQWETAQSSYICQKSVYDQSITSIRTETSGPTSVLVSWMLLNQTLSSNETFSIYYSTGGREMLAGTTHSLMYNITGLVSNVNYPIRIEMFSQMQNSSLQTFHLLKDILQPITIPCSFPTLYVPTDSSTTFSSLPPISPTPSSLPPASSTPSSLPPASSTPSSLPPVSSTLFPMLPSSAASTPTNPINETIPTPTEVPILATNFQFTHQLAITMGVMLIILFFVLFIVIISIILCCCMKSMKRSPKANQENTLQYLHEHVNQANSKNAYSTIETKDKFEGDSFVSNPMYEEMSSSAHKDNLVKTPVSCPDSEKYILQ